MCAQLHQIPNDIPDDTITSLPPNCVSSRSLNHHLHVKASPELRCRQPEVVENPQGLPPRTPPLPPPTSRKRQPPYYKTSDLVTLFSREYDHYLPVYSSLTDIAHTIEATDATQIEHLLHLRALEEYLGSLRSIVHKKMGQSD
jgi:hypothetical protein